ncbi:restriction endonuclease subunit S [Streptococcus suis]|uniref:restriction endonuclease subunit S n=1 Tax=Streptococcus suis TaxID=1307 RepID=UPI0038B9737D
MGELGTLKNGMNFSKDAMGIGFPFINLQNIFGKNIVDVSQLGLAKASSIQLKNYNLQKGDVLFVRSSVKLEGVGEAAIVPKNLENTTYSGFIIRYRDSFGLDYNFKRFTFGTSNIRNQIMSQATDSANKNISQQVLAELDILVPSLPEQEAIGTFFSTLDRHITLHQRKLDTLKEQKKTYLKLFFPAKGQTKPALRFQGFEDDWEEVKLGEVVNIQKGTQRGKQEISEIQSEQFPYPVYNGGQNVSGYTDEYNRENMVIVSEGGASAGYVNYYSGKFWSGGHNFSIDNLDNNLLFIKSILEFNQQKLYELKVGSGLPNVQLGSINQFVLSLPSLPEQEFIGTFFQTLDQEIAQVEDKLASLKEMKKTLLRKLFV